MRTQIRTFFSEIFCTFRSGLGRSGANLPNLFGETAPIVAVLAPLLGPPRLGLSGFDRTRRPGLRDVRFTRVAPPGLAHGRPFGTGTKEGVELKRARRNRPCRGERWTKVDRRVVQPPASAHQKPRPIPRALNRTDRLPPAGNESSGTMRMD